MFTENTFQAEIAYRGDRIRNGVALRPKRRHRNPFVRRPADTGTAR